MRYTLGGSFGIGYSPESTGFDAMTKPSCEACGRQVGFRVNGVCRDCLNSGGAYARPSQKLPCRNCGRHSGFLISGLCDSCRDEILATARANTRARRIAPTAQRPPARNDAFERELERKAQQEREASCELKGWSEGRRLGAEYHGDPWKLAQALRATVAYGDGHMMRKQGHDGVTMLSPSGGPAYILLANDVLGRKRDELLAHELGHVLGLDSSDRGEVSKWTGERACDSFAKELMAQRPETPQEAAARFRREIELRAQREARLRALARR